MQRGIERIDFPGLHIDNPHRMAPVSARLASSFPLILEDLLILIAACVILARLRRASSGVAARKRPFHRIYLSRTVTILLPGLAVTVLRCLLIPILGIPEPLSHDEFSYLLAADTFAHGRMTNATHPLWIHFESFHIIHQPTYQSIYPPAQGLVLAAGQLLGHPWIGALLITAALCSCICWMLLGWFSPYWALFGALLAALRLGLLSYWMNGYWSTSLVAFGGALVLGAWPRIKRRPRARDSVLMALGLALLANTRPYEGLLFSLPFAVEMIGWSVGNHAFLPVRLRRVVLPLTLSLVAAGLGTGLYYQRVTGHPFQMTYQVDYATYAATPYFIWGTLRPEPVYHHPILRAFYERERSRFIAIRTFPGWLSSSVSRLLEAWRFYLGPLLTLAFLPLPSILCDHRIRLPLIVVQVALVGALSGTWFLPHYLAPATGALYILIVQGLRHLSHWRIRRQLVGPTLVRAVFILCCVAVGVRVWAAAEHLPVEFPWPRGNLERARILRLLESTPGQHVVIVRYAPDHNLDSEWVYNRADIDHAKVIWARDMGIKNIELERYLHAGKFWTVNADDPHPHLEDFRP